MQDSLILNVYLDPAGKALVTGYADNISGLEFLARSEYQYENDTRRLYALTDGLTAKSNQLWTLDLGAEGVFEDYRITFYLPEDIRLDPSTPLMAFSIISPLSTIHWWRMCRDMMS